MAQNAYLQHNLVSDLPALADNVDTNLVNPWGIAFSGNSPFWIADNHAGVSTLYDGAGTAQSLIVTIPPPSGGTPPAAPTGLIFNNTTNFVVASNAVARFIFATEDGTIVGWNNASGAQVKADRSASGAIYKGLAPGNFGGSNYLYATDFHNGKVDVFDASYNPVTLPGTFTDTNLPAGFAPFGIANVNGQLLVTYAVQDAAKEDDIQGPGNGLVNVFDAGGTFIKRFASSNSLNSPWGLVKAPASFGPFGGALLIGNFGDGRINAYDLGGGAWLGTLNDAAGQTPVEIPGLWGLTFGNGANAGNPNTLYFTAGIPGSGSLEDHGLFGSLAPKFPARAVGVSYRQQNLVSDLPGLADHTDTNLVNPWGIAFSASGPFWISDNHSGFSTIYNGSGTPQSLIVTIPAPPGSTSPAAPTGIIFNGTTNFVVASNAPARFIFATEDGTISGWPSGPGAILKVDNSGAGTIYKGLAVGSSGGKSYLYATDFHGGKIDVFDSTFNPATLAGSFADPTIPAGFAPFNIQNLNGQLFVTYAMQDADKEDDVPGPGLGFVNVFDTNGQLIKRFASNGVLNAPWGLAIAPSGFGGFAGALLIGNFGDGRINAFDPSTGTWLGVLLDEAGNPFSIEGLWAIIFGNGGNGGDAHTLYFTAGINDENDGVFGSLAPIVPSFTNPTDKGLALELDWAGGTAPFLVQKKVSLSESNWFDVVTTSNRSVTLAKEGDAGFFRLVSEAANTVLAFTVLLNGASEVPAESTDATGLGTLSLEGSTLTYHIAFSGLSGAANGAHIHSPATPTNSAPVVVTLSAGAGNAGTLSGTVTLTSDQIADIVNGLAYINIHTDNHPGGEIRGQIVPLHSTVTLSGSAEAPPVATSASGAGSLTLIGSQLFYSVKYSGLTGAATAAHIHGPADPGVPGAVLVPLNTPTGTSGTISGTVSLTPTVLAYLLAGQTYINIHSLTNTGGEIRGQIYPMQLGATLNGASEVPPTASNGSGSGQMVILNSMLNYNISFTNLLSAATAAHIHGPADTAHNANVLIPLTAPPATFGVIAGSTLLTSDQLVDVVEGRTYVNIHTTNYSGGEIRGQIMPQN